MSGNVGLRAPLTKNLLIGKGFCIFKPEGEDDFFHLGNVPNLVWTPNVTKLDHFSSMEGIKEKDESTVTEQAATLKITMEEFTANNMRLLLMGDIDDTDPNHILVNVYSRTSITGEFRFYATNTKGPRWRFFLNKVQLTPQGDFSPISENYANMIIQGDVFAVDGNWGTAELVTAAAPENITLPFLTWDGNSLIEGSIATVSNGGWLDVDSYTYQWKKGGVNIGGATSKTFTVTASEVGSELTCEVTGTNDFGTDVAVSEGSDVTS